MRLSRHTSGLTALSCGHPATYPRHPRGPTPAQPRHRSAFPPFPFSPFRLFPFSPFPPSFPKKSPAVAAATPGLPSLLTAYFFSSSTFPVVLVPHMGQRISTSAGLPMNFSRIFSGGMKLTSPQAHAGHSARTKNFLLVIQSSPSRPMKRRTAPAAPGRSCANDFLYI
jgi:hypothetical protein